MNCNPKNRRIIESVQGLCPQLEPWLTQDQGPGRFARQWLQTQMDAAVADVFGYHALQLGLPHIHTLAKSRIPHRWYAVDPSVPSETPCISLYANATALPFFEATIDLITLPLTLDAHAHPEQVLRECARVLVPEGRLVMVGFNLKSLWGMRQVLGRGQWPASLCPYGYRRLLQDLQTLGLQVQSGRFGAYSSCVPEQTMWLEKAGDRWWPHWGGLYVLSAVKRVVQPSLRLLPKWQWVDYARAIGLKPRKVAVSQAGPAPRA